MQISTGLGNVTEALQSERAEIAFYLFTNGSVIRRNLSEHFAYTNSLIDNLKWPTFRIEDPLFKNKILFRIRLDDFRDKITKFDTPSIDAGIRFYNRANYIFLDQVRLRQIWYFSRDCQLDMCGKDKTKNLWRYIYCKVDNVALSFTYTFFVR